MLWTGGSADYISPESGFLIEPKSRAYMVESFARIIDELASQPALRHQIGVEAMKRVTQHFLWDKKIKNIIEVYREAIESKHA